MNNIVEMPLWMVLTALLASVFFGYCLRGFKELMETVKEETSNEPIFNIGDKFFNDGLAVEGSPFTEPNPYNITVLDIKSNKSGEQWVKFRMVWTIYGKEIEKTTGEASCDKFSKLIENCEKYENK